MNYKYLFSTNLLLGILILFSHNSKAQDNLLDLLGDDQDKVHDTFATFKSTRIVNGHTVDFESEGELQLLIQHRFLPLSNGANKFWGLDGASMRIGLEYGLKDIWAIGFGRSPSFGTFDFYNKLKFLKQSRGTKEMPISAVLVSTIFYRSQDIETSAQLESKHRYIYTNQLLLARKFNKNFSLQVMPTYYHRNLIERNEGTENSFFILGLAARYKVSNRTALVIEYFNVFEHDLMKTHKNPISFGLEIETGGHVFQLHITNTKGMSDARYITSTVDNDLRFGFNISRVFQLKNNDDE